MPTGISGIFSRGISGGILGGFPGRGIRDVGTSGGTPEGISNGIPGRILGKITVGALGGIPSGICACNGDYLAELAMNIIFAYHAVLFITYRSHYPSQQNLYVVQFQVDEFPAEFLEQFSLKFLKEFSVEFLREFSVEFLGEFSVEFLESF